VSKVRLTGGEPFVRQDLMNLMQRLTGIPGIRDLHLTTNGVLTAPYVPELKAMGLASVNLSLDTLNSARFKATTRRDEFDRVMKSFDAIMNHDIRLKINAVVLEGRNIEDIIPPAQLT